MTTVIIEDYPADRLPDDLRGPIDPATRVRVTLDVPAKDDPLAFKPKRLRDFIGAGKRLHDSPEDVVASIRALRDEWD